MSTVTQDAAARANDGPTLVDARAPRFGQAITASGLALGIALQQPLLVYAVAAALLTAVLTRWRYDPYGLLWRLLVGTVVGRGEREPAAPHRFAKLLGAVGTTLASALFLAGFPLPAYVVAGLIAVPAALGATTGLCIGCRMYRGVSFFRRLDVV